jgi:hypothetical protein
MVTTMKTELEKLTAAPGILAAYGVERGVETIVFAKGSVPFSQEEKAQRHDLLAAARAILEVSTRMGFPGEEVRVLMGHYTMIVQQCGGVTLGVVFVKGDNIVKSLARMMRKTFLRLKKAANVERTDSPAFASAEP